MNKHDTLLDFINAIVTTGRGEKTGDINQYLRRDWQSILNKVITVGKIAGVSMAEINSILTQRCLPCLLQAEILPSFCETGNTGRT